jgi:hypothetical protein
MPNKNPEELNGINQEKGELRINRERNYIAQYRQQSSPEQTNTRIILIFLRPFIVHIYHKDIHKHIHLSGH